MKLNTKKNINAVPIKENDTKASSSITFNKANLSNNLCITKNANNPTLNSNTKGNSNSGIKLSVNSNSLRSFSPNGNTKISATPSNTKIHRPNYDIDFSNSFKRNSHRRTSNSTNELKGVKIRKDNKGNIILKGSKLFHMYFCDNLLRNKKPLVEVIDVESYKKENVNEFLTDDYDSYDDDPNRSSTCHIF